MKVRGMTSDAASPRLKASISVKFAGCTMSAKFETSPPTAAHASATPVVLARAELNRHNNAERARLGLRSKWWVRSKWKACGGKRGPNS